MIKSQRGMGALILVIVLAIAGALGYYAYKTFSKSDEPENCPGSFMYCMKVCRGTTTEAATAQLCKEGCERDQAICERQTK